MRTVLYDDETMEPITVLELPSWAYDRLRDGNRLRFPVFLRVLGYVGSPDIRDVPEMSETPMVTVWFEQFMRNDQRGIPYFANPRNRGKFFTWLRGPNSQPKDPRGIDYGKTGRREPTIRIGAPVIVVTLNHVPESGSGSDENAKFAEVSACLRRCPFPVLSGINNPNRIVLLGFQAPEATCHPAAASTCDSCTANASASGSPSIYRRLTAPVVAERALLRVVTWSAEILRQATACFNFSVSSRASAACFSKRAARSCACAAASFAFAASVLAASEDCSAAAIRLSASACITSETWYETKDETTANAAPTAVSTKPPHIVHRITDCQNSSGWPHHIARFPVWAVTALITWVLLAIALSGFFLFRAQRRSASRKETKT